MQTHETPHQEATAEPPMTGSGAKYRGWKPWMIVAAVVAGVAATGLVIWALADSSDNTSDQANIATAGADPDFVAEGPSDFVVDFVERWGRAWESGDNDAVRALYWPDAETSIVDRMHQAVWTDVDDAINMVNSTKEFERFELVRVEQFTPHHFERPPSGFVVAEYEVEFVPEEPGGDPGQPSTVVVVFIGFGEDGIMATDIYLEAWPSFVTGQTGYADPYKEREEGWIIVD